MGIWERVETLVRSYVQDDGGRRKHSVPGSSGDADIDAAFEELDAFLKNEKPRAEAPPNGGDGSGASVPPLSEAIKRDFAELGLPPGAGAEDCKTAYKRLLKTHHPDRHTDNPERQREATEKSARINAAYERIERWRRGEPL